MSGFDFNQASDQRAAVLQNAAGMCADWQTVLSAVRQELLVRQWSAGDIVPDGDLHRFSTDANRRGDTAGWYIAHSDGVPCVMFGDWRTGEVETVTGLDPELQKTGIPLRVITQRELDEHREWIETQKKRREEDRAAADMRAREKSRQIYATADEITATDTLPYLARKGIALAPGAKVTRNGTILVPIYDSAGLIAGLQSIYPDGKKRFMDGMSVKGRLGWIEGLGQHIYICEGFATACSIHAATGCSVAIAFSCNNLGPVAELIRSKFPGESLVFCADNDQWTKNAKGEPVNPGVESAKKAARKVNGKVVIPAFGSLDGNPTDFNDLMVREGLEAVKRQVTPDLASPLVQGWTLDLFDDVPETQEWLVKDTLPLAYPCILAAAGGTGKGMLALDLALSVAGNGEGCALDLNKSAQTGKWLGSDVVGHGTAVIITAEDSKTDIGRRLRLIDPDGSRRAAARGRMFVVPLPDAGGPIQLVRPKPGWHAGYEPTEAFLSLEKQFLAMKDLKLINIDPLASFAGIDINTDPQAGQFIQGLFARLATETGACVLVAHHLGKTKDRKGFSIDTVRESIRGTTALVDGVRLAIAIVQADDGTLKKVRAEHPELDITPYDVCYGAVVKANCTADRTPRLLVRRNGLLQAETLAGDSVTHAEVLNRLEKTIREAVENGHPFTSSGMAGFYHRRADLPEPLCSYTRDKLRWCVEELRRTHRVTASTLQGSKATGKYFDVPGGPISLGLEYEILAGDITRMGTDAGGESGEPCQSELSESGSPDWAQKPPEKGRSRVPKPSQNLGNG